MYEQSGSISQAERESGPGNSNWQPLIMQFVLTTGLVRTILGTASRAQNLGPISAFGDGAYITLAGICSSPISRASLNPVRSFSRDLVLWNFSSYWVYLVWPIASALVVVGIAYILRGRVVGQSGIKAAQRRLVDLVAENAVQPGGSAQTT